MNHRRIASLIGFFIIIAVTVGGVVYWQWPSTLPELVVGPPPAEAAPPITWTPSSVHEVVGQGQTKTVTASFKSSENLKNVVVRVVPELQPFVQVNPSSFASIAKGQMFSIDITIAASSTAPLGTATGTIQLRSGRGAPKAFARPLPVSITVLESGIPGVAFAVPLSWTVQSHGSLLSLLSPATLIETTVPGAAHVEPDVTIQRLLNPEGIVLQDFSLELYEGLFAAFPIREDVTVGGRPAVRFSNEGGQVDRAPVIAVFVSLPNGSFLVVTVPGYEADLTSERMAGFEQVLASLSFE